MSLTSSVETNGQNIPRKAGLSSDVRVVSVAMYLLPVQMRVPLKFGGEIVRRGLCARVCLTVIDRQGNSSQGWGETPLMVQWAWPSKLSHASREDSMVEFCRRLAGAWVEYDAWGHPFELGHDFQQHVLPALTKSHELLDDDSGLPYLAALICESAFDIALYDAFGNLHEVDVYETLGKDWLSRDLSAYLTPAADRQDISFEGLFPSDFLVKKPPLSLPAWHLVGGLDPLEPEQLAGDEPDDGYPLLLRDWIKTDGLTCLKVKLCGTDDAWDYQRMVCVGKIAEDMGVEALSADFNCCVQDPAYVNDILDRLAREHPSIDERILYVEQPFPYELEKHHIDVHSVSQRKPLFLDESAHDWQHVRLGRELGWTGVALKTCKTQTGALLSLCWAKAHGMPLMVQDLTNPMLAQIPHVRLAAHAGTIMGVETNGMQFYPAASAPEAAIHPGLYSRRSGQVDLSSLSGSGFGYRVEEIERKLPAPDTIITRDS